MWPERARRVQQVAEALPKVELHLHLDGSLDPAFLEEQSLKQSLPLPVPTGQIRSYLLTRKQENLLATKSNSVSIGQNWSTFDFCNAFLQTEEAIQSSMISLLRHLRSCNVVYAEIRFCPELHTRKGLSLDQVIQAAIRGFEVDSGVAGGIIVCALRSLSEDHGLSMAGLASKYLHAGVLGFDVVGDEGTFPLNNESCAMVKGVRHAVEHGVPVSIHAGEWPDPPFHTLSNIEFAVNDLCASRIGHGLALSKGRSAALKQTMRDRPVTLEICMTSNIAFGYKAESYAKHPVREFISDHLPFTLSSDNLLLSGDFDNAPSPAGEIVHLVTDVFAEDHVAGWRAVKSTILSGVNAAFCPNFRLQAPTIEKRIDDVFADFGIDITSRTS